jgi:hypothetical protein
VTPYKYFNDRVGLHTFTLRTSGHIYCDECDEVWCNHVKQAMVKRWDAAAIWDKPDDSEYPREMELQIPMFPTFNIWTQVKLYFPEDTPVPRYRVVWIDHAPVWPTICFINPGEGRNIIRASLVDYMLGDSNKQKECSAPHHGFQAQTIWERETREGNSKLWPQLWSVYTTGKCLTCSKIDPSSDPDLVPPNQKTGVWNTSRTTVFNPGGIV